MTVSQFYDTCHTCLADRNHLKFHLPVTSGWGAIRLSIFGKHNWTSWSSHTISLLTLVIMVSFEAQYACRVPWNYERVPNNNSIALNWKNGFIVFPSHKIIVLKNHSYFKNPVNQSEVQLGGVKPRLDHWMCVLTVCPSRPFWYVGTAMPIYWGTIPLYTVLLSLGLVKYWFSMHHHLFYK